MIHGKDHVPGLEDLPHGFLRIHLDDQQSPRADGLFLSGEFTQVHAHSFHKVLPRRRNVL